jgi:multidrug efflux pump subunit AcrA (membrane-fusion protein)
MGKRIKKFSPLLILLILLVIIFTKTDWINRRKDPPLRVSGTIEAVEVVVAAQIGGQIDQILVNEGDQVQTGDVLVRLNDEMLQAQFESAQAALVQAQTNYLLMAAQPLAEERDARISAAQLDHLNAQQSLKDLFENADLARANAAQALEDAENALEDHLNSDLNQSLALEAIAKAEKDTDSAEKRLAILTKPPSQAAIDQAYANMMLADDAMTQTIQDIEMAVGKLRRGLGPYYPKNIVDDYKKQLRVIIQNLEFKLSRDQLANEHSIHRYNQLLSPVDPVELALAEAELAMAEAQLGQKQREYERIKDGPSKADIAVLEARIEVARREYGALSDGPDLDDLVLAEAWVRSAEANLSLAQADTIQEQLDAAKAQVDSAQAALGVIQSQLDKLVLTAPVDGVVLIRNIEEGEVLKPGIEAITIGLLDDARIHVYLPEVYYGSVQESDQVRIRLDAFPDQPTSGKIVWIAEESEFITRHIERAEGGWDAVFAVTIVVDDARQLKPGMLATVEFAEP